MIRPLLVAGLLTLLGGCMPPLAGGLASDRPVAARDHAGAPAYRFIRSVRRPALLPPDFHAALASRWLPALSARHGPDGLSAYISALPPAAEAGLPDEVALAACGSEAAHEGTWAGLAAAGEALFDPSQTERARVVPLAAELVAGTAYDVLQRPADWQEGFTTFFIGERQSDVPADDFLRRLRGQVGRERAAFAAQGLEGYVFLATRDHKLSFMHWPDMQAFGRAMASPEGQAVAAESRRLMRTVQFAGAAAFQGGLAAGRVVRLRKDP